MSNKSKKIEKSELTEEKPPKKEYKDRKVYGKYYIDMKHYKNNILTLKYTKTANVVPTFKSIIMSAQIKPMIKEMLDMNYIDNAKYEKLSSEDKRLIDHLSKFLEIKNDFKQESDDDFQKQFDILLGEKTAGNNNPLINVQLRKYILQAINENRMTRNQGFQLLLELNV
jgi:hypothetical protein